ncbi:MAG: aminotransferase class I/II-fold pyridoxal phosphate-dependent enzyme [Thermogladius sp.]|jgi:aspartate aminotransferase|nr:aminotransferase class I/II-fold pyridoxal phosphate-dependent enzyme [Thermogladius sp.]
MPGVSRRSASIKTSPHRVLVALADELRRKGRRVIDFTAGQPGLPPDARAVAEFIEFIAKNTFTAFRYAPTQGLPELREEISADLKRYGGVEVPADNILVTSGGLDGIILSLYATTDPGDRVLLLEPCYSMYWDTLRFLGLEAEWCSESVETGFQPSVDCILEKLGRVKAILFASPDNPTSRVIDRGVAKAIAEEASRRKVWVLYDVAYKHIVYEGEHVWLEKYVEDPDILVNIGSFSKDIAIPGGRLGYVYSSNKTLIRELVKLKGILGIVAPVPMQWLAAIYLKKGWKERYLEEVLPVYKRRRDAAYDAVRKYLPRARVAKPTASMYVFPDLSPYLAERGLNDLDFTVKLAEEKGVVALPGSIFGPSGVNHVRITFVTNDEKTVEEGIKLIGEFLGEV